MYVEVLHYCRVLSAFSFLDGGFSDSSRFFTTANLSVFAGVRAVLSKVGLRDAKLLWTLMKLHGAKMETSLTKETTHLITEKAEGVSPLLF